MPLCARLRKASVAAGAIAISMITAAHADAAETVTYQYDALGRLTKKSSAGTVNTNKLVTVCYDAAGNRKIYKVAANGATVSCTAPPPPTNLPPVANADTAPSIPQCGSTNVNVTANDTDPEGNLPLTVTSASSGAALIVTVQSASTVGIVSTGASGSKSFSYTVQDSLGATSTGNGTILVTTVNQCS